MRGEYSKRGTSGFERCNPAAGFSISERTAAVAIVRARESSVILCNLAPTWSWSAARDAADPYRRGDARSGSAAVRSPQAFPIAA